MFIFLKRRLETLKTFQRVLRLQASLALSNQYWLVSLLTSLFVWSNRLFNRPKQADTTHQLAETWLDMMPPEARNKEFRIDQKASDDHTAFVEIHLHCPLRDSNKRKACHELMAYDRKLLEGVGGELEVLSSQSTNGLGYCRLAIRRKDNFSV